MQNRNPHVYYEGQVQNINEFIHCKYNLARQGNEEKIRYFYIKGGTSWSFCNYGISGKFRQH